MLKTLVIIKTCVQFSAHALECQKKELMWFFLLLIASKPFGIFIQWEFLPIAVAFFVTLIRISEKIDSFKCSNHFAKNSKCG